MSEVQHGSLAVPMATPPTRWVVATVKVAMAIGYGLALGATGLLSGYAGALAGELEMGETSGFSASIGWALTYTTLSDLLGLGIGMIVRHTAMAIGGPLVWGLIIKGVIGLFLPIR